MDWRYEKMDEAFGFQKEENAKVPKKSALIVDHFSLVASDKYKK